MKVSRCKTCGNRCQDMTKRFDPVLGTICADCHGFLSYSDKVLRRHGIQHVTLKPHRHAPKEDVQ